MNSKLPPWLRMINWTVVFTTILWITYDRVLQPMVGWSITFSTSVLYSWLRDIAILAMGIGLMHVVFVHLRRVWQARSSWGYSLLLLVATTAVVAMGLGDGTGPNGAALQWVYAYVLAPAEAALMASTLFVLAGAVWVALRLRRRGMQWLIVGLLPALALQMPWVNAFVPVPLAPYLDGAMHLIATPVMRGLLLGTGLLLIASFVQYLVGEPRPPEPES